MAHYHIEASIIKRSEGHSIVSRVAYVMKNRLKDNYTGKSYCYKTRHTTLAWIALPSKAPHSFANPQTLLDALNEVERRSDAQMARSYVLSLPVELDLRQQIELVRSFAFAQFVKNGQAVIIGIHLREANREGREALPPRVGLIRDNPHAHLIVPFRLLDYNGFRATKTESRQNNNPKYLIKLRDEWADIQNRTFERLGLEVRVSSKSLIIQGIYRTPAQHLDRVSFGREVRGIRTQAGDRYRQVHRVRMRENRNRSINIERTPSRGR